MGHAALKGLAILIGQAIGGCMEALDDALGIVEALQSMADRGTGGDGVGALLIEVGLGIGHNEMLGSQQQQGGELLVLMADAGGEAEIAQNGTAEHIATG